MVASAWIFWETSGVRPWPFRKSYCPSAPCSQTPTLMTLSYRRSLMCTRRIVLDMKQRHENGLVNTLSSLSLQPPVLFSTTPRHYLTAPASNPVSYSIRTDPKPGVSWSWDLICFCHQLCAYSTVFKFFILTSLTIWVVWCAPFFSFPPFSPISVYAPLRWRELNFSYEQYVDLPTTYAISLRPAFSLDVHFLKIRIILAEKIVWLSAPRVLGP